MRRSVRRGSVRALLAGGLLAGGLLAGACGSDDGGSSTGDAPAADASTTTAADGAAGADGSGAGHPETLGDLLLATVPAGADTIVALNDIERLVADAGLDPLPAGGVDPDEVDRARATMSSDWGMTNLAQDLGTVRSEAWLETVGFGPGDVARAVTSSAAPEQVVTVVGDLDPDGIVATLGSWSDTEVREAEPWILVDEPGEEGDLGAVITPVNRIGSPLRYAVDQGRFVMSRSSELRDAAVAGLDGEGSTLADEAGWSPLADVAEERGWYSVLAVTRPPDLLDGIPPSDRDELPPRPLVRVAAVSVAEGAPLPHLAFVYDRPEDADEAAGLLERRLESTTSTRGEPWLDLSPEATVTVAGAIVLIELPGAGPLVPERAIYEQASIVQTR